jgi:hypothetical protein
MHAGAACEACTKGEHSDCVGWKPTGFCGCADGMCEFRLITGVMRNLDDPPDSEEEP